jgi:hypothetical protein
MMEGLGVIHSVVQEAGKGVAYQYVDVSKFILIHTYNSGVYQI